MPEVEAVVVDTDVYSRVVLLKTPAGGYEPYVDDLLGRSIVLAAQTVAELRYWPLVRGWAGTKTQDLESKLARAARVPVDDDLTHVYAELKDQCRRAGHALAEKHHDGDPWVAATALHLGLRLVSHDGIFSGLPGVT